MIYQHPLAYLLGLEGLALLRAWAGDEDYDERFVRERLAAVRSLLDDAELSSHPGVLIERNATEAAYAQWAASYDHEGNGLFDLDEPVIDAIVGDAAPGPGDRRRLRHGPHRGPARRPRVRGDRGRQLARHAGASEGAQRRGRLRGR